MKRTLFSLLIASITCIFAEEPMEIITPEYRYPLKRPVTATMGVDLIVWSAQESGLDFAVSGYDSSGDTLTTHKGSVLYPGFRWDPGFKVNVDVVMPHDGWDTKLEYTWYHMNQSDQSINSRTAGLPVNGTWTNDTTDLLPVVDEAHGNWKITHQDVNWELGRACTVSKFLHIRPYAGIKGAWQMQDNYVQYQDFFDTTTVLTNFDMSQHFWGVGLRGGTNMAFDLVYCLKIISNAAVSLLGSSFSVSQKTYQPSLPNNLIYMNYANDVYAITPVMEWQMGLQWATLVDDKSFGMIIDLLFEQQVWWNMNHFERILGTNSNQTLNFQGLTARFAFTF